MKRKSMVEAVIVEPHFWSCPVMPGQMQMKRLGHIVRRQMPCRARERK